MARFQDLARIFAGLALVAREAAQTTPALTRLRSGDITGFASSTIARVVTASTDLAGLTQGRLHHPPVYPSELETLSQERSTPDFSQSQPSREEFANANCISGMEQFPVNELQESSTSTHPISQDTRFDSITSADMDRVTQAHPFELKQDNLGVEGRHQPLVVQVSNTESDTVGIEGRTSPVQVQAIDDADADGPPQALPRVGKKRKPRERRVPTTPFGRAFGFARLGAGLALGTLQESAKRLWVGQGSSLGGQSVLSPFLTEQNAERLALALCRMRGAALKLGQMLSIQDDSLLPPQVLAALETVRQGADVMPRRQLNRVIEAELGSGWHSRLNSFDYDPMAAASIGQVHKAVLKDGMDVAMKIQYPGVANSIDSDIENVRRLWDYTNLIPKGLYLDQAIKVAKEELARECDYNLEAANQKRFRQLLAREKGVYVPLVIDDFSSKCVLTTELVAGVPIDKVAEMNQNIRDSVGRRLLYLTLQELFVYRFMQTDPNWSNFLYEEKTDTINLIDFGAAREYPKHFVDNYLKMVFACANRDRENVIEMSCRLGFLTGQESTIMLDAHTEAAFVVGLPFSGSGGFDFQSSNLTRRVSELGATMLQHRLTPPPDEAYSLHRKLSGAFLACIKLGAVIPCREIFLDVYENHIFSDQEDEQEAVLA